MFKPINKEDILMDSPGGAPLREERKEAMRKRFIEMGHTPEDAEALVNALSQVAEKSGHARIKPL